MQVVVTLDDINDNPPRFTRHTFTAGVTVESKYGSRVTKLTVCPLSVYFKVYIIIIINFHHRP